MITRNFNLYLNAGHSVPLVINANQFDSGEQWVFTLYNSDGTKYVPSTGAIVGIKSDNLGIINSGSVVDGKVVITETQQMTAAPGRAVFELMIDNGTHGTANFVLMVEPKPGNNADLSDSDLSLIQEALDAVNPLPTGGSVGQVLTKTANGSTWSNAGTPTQEQVADAVSDWADEHITVTTGVVIDTSLSVAGAAADAKKTGDEITDLKSAIGQSTGMSAEFKQALETLLAHVSYQDDDPSGRTYLNALHNAMYPPANLTSISAVYTQTSAVYDTDSLDSLKSDLVVTAHYDNQSTEIVTTYTLSGTLTEGTSTITVSYGGKTTTFNVTVSSTIIRTLTNSDFTIGVNQNIYRGKGASGYIDTGTKTRFGYSYFDILTEAGATYQITYDWNTEYDLYGGAAIYDENVLTEVENHQQVTAVDDSGWQHLSDINGTFTITATNNSAIRVSSKIGSAGTATYATGITYINSVTIRKL